MNTEEYKRISDGIDKAQESTTPFLINDDELAVVGDANRIEHNVHDFTIHFRAPVTKDGKTQYVKTTKTYKDVYITPMVETRVQTMIGKLLPYYRKPKEDGTVDKYSDEEAREIADRFDVELTETLYNTVATVLGVPTELIPYMEKDSVLDAAAQIIVAYPEMINASETFFE